MFDVDFDKIISCLSNYPLAIMTRLDYQLENQLDVGDRNFDLIAGIFIMF